MFKLEPIGSTHFSSDVIWDEKGHARISYIYVTFTDYGIKSIQFIYFHEGVHVESQKHGHFGGEHTIRVKLENDEYLTALSGNHYEHRITSLTFHTNKGKHGPFCRRYSGYHNFMRKIDVGICDRSEFCGLYGSFSEGKYGGYLTSIGMYVSHNISIIDQVPRTSFGAPYDHQFVHLESMDHTTTRGHYQCPNVVDGFPVKPISRRKPKLKDRILSKFNKVIQFIINL
ncbi:Jacalin-related lectin 24 [Hirschfeldia incana]|nr:Jacalin-related lectin 24 [Hirschfeldia incana]